MKYRKNVQIILTLSKNVFIMLNVVTNKNTNEHYSVLIDTTMRGIETL